MDRDRTVVFGNPLGSFASFGDIGAFPEPGRRARGPHAGGAGGPVDLASGRRPGPASATPAAPTASREVLIGGRFVVSVTWDDGFGQTGNGSGRQMTEDTAAFTFFSETNTELVIKVLDGQAINGHYWVFYGALSNVGYAISIRDTLTGQLVIYQNPVGNFASVGDIEAF